MFLLEDKTTAYKGQLAQITIINVEKTVVLLEFVEMVENFKIYFMFCSCTSHKEGHGMCLSMCAVYMCVFYVYGSVMYTCVCGYVLSLYVCVLCVCVYTCV